MHTQDEGDGYNFTLMSNNEDGALEHDLIRRDLDMIQKVNNTFLHKIDELKNSKKSNMNYIAEILNKLTLEAEDLVSYTLYLNNPIVDSSNFQLTDFRLWD